MPHDWWRVKGISRKPVLVIGPGEEPLSRDFVQNYTKYEEDCDAEIVDFHITSARTSYERVTRRQLLLATYDYFLDCFPLGENAIEIPRPPLVSITEFEYFDADDVLTPLPASVYDTQTVTEPGQVFLKPEQEWPEIGLTKQNVIRIRFTAGAATRALVPYDDRTAVLLLASHWIENRLPVVVGDDLESFEVPETVQRIQKMRRIPEIR